MSGAKMKTPEEIAVEIIGKHYKACLEDIAGRPVSEEEMICVCSIGKIANAIRQDRKRILDAIESCFCKHHPKESIANGGCDTNETVLEVLGAIKKVIGEE